MIDIIVIDLGCANSINQLFLKNCTLDKIAEESLDFFFVGKRGIDFVGLFLKGSHFTLYGL